MKVIAMPLLIATALVLQACGGQSDTESGAAGKEQVGLETPEQRLSYSIAYSLGQNMEADRVPVQIDAFALGISDAMSRSEPRLSAQEMESEIKAFREQRAAQVEAQKEEQAESNAAEAEAFLATNAAREAVVTMESGLQYEVLEAGGGPRPEADDQVKVHYRGTLADGSEFDSSYARGQPATFGVGQVIPGWTEALQLMPVGAKWKLYIPPELGYGARGAGGRIPPNAALVFEVELLDVVDSAAQQSEEQGAAEG